jgi:hypothetical protein
MEATNNGKSTAIDVSSLTKIGNKSKWSGSIVLTKNGAAKTGSADLRSLAKMIVDSGDLAQFGDLSFKISVSSKLKLRISRSDYLEIPKDWSHEFHVQNKIKDYLKRAWGEPIQESNCLIKGRKSQGPDLLFEQPGTPPQQLQVEAKGYPSKDYADTNRRDEKKRTRPENQAVHWFGEALLCLIRAKKENPNLSIAMGLPKMQPYEKLWGETKSAMDKLGITCYWVSEYGEVMHSGN